MLRPDADFSPGTGSNSRQSLEMRFDMRKNISIAIMAVLVLGLFVPVWAQDDNGPTSSLQFVVVRDSDGKPVRNAQVVLHPVKRKGKQENGELELKTDMDGKASVDGIPYGPLRVQVLAPHFQTYGEDYEVNQAQMGITVKLKHPSDQYSTDGNDKKPQ
jgi:Carboxypeptidase regulatory-like domain